MNKKKYSDFQTLAEMLDISVDAAKKRFYRNDAEAVEKMKIIIDSRENLISLHKSPAN